MPETRHHTAILALIAAVAAAAFVLFVRSDGGDGGEPFGGPPAAVDPERPPEDPVQPRTTPEGPVRPAEPRSIRDAERVEQPAGPPPSEGTLDVRITPTASVAGTFAGGTLRIEEMIDPESPHRPDRRPFARVVPFDADPYQSPYYAVVDGIPFSPYGYRVTVSVTGLNGSSQVVRVAADAWNPQVDLNITGAATYTLRLVDQEFEPYLDEMVTLIPVGEPKGRPIVQATTDNFGTAIFESLLAGDYDVRIGHDVRETLTVDRPGFVRDDLDVGVQSKQLQLPRGATLKIEVFDVVQYALGGVQVRAIALDTVRNRRYEDETDVNGVCTFEHVVPGRYQVDVIARGYQQTSRTVIVEAGKDPEPIQFRMPRLH